MLQSKLGKTVVVVIVSLIILAFALMGMPSKTQKDESQGATVIAKIDDDPVTASDLQAGFQEEAMRQSQFGRRVTIRDLIQQGAAGPVLDKVLASKLFFMAVDESDLAFSQDYLEECLRSGPRFQDENGQLDQQKWKDWVTEG